MDLSFARHLTIMDLIGEIVEHDVGVPTAPEPVSADGFPKPGRLRQKKVSRFKQSQARDSNPVSKPSPSHTHPDRELSEAEKIHEENLQKISELSEQEINDEREELLAGLDPQLVKSLLARTEKRLRDDALHHEHADGHDGWIGGFKDGAHLDPADVDRALGIEKPIADKSKKTVKFAEVTTVKYEDLDESVHIDESGWEDVEDINDLLPNAGDIAPDDYQLLSEKDEFKVHFPKPKEEDLDLNDPQFFDKLHEKYYPDLPKETHKLSWMTEPMPEKKITTYESISDLRFDFKGNLVTLDKQEIPTYLGLHHHSADPQLAGYTLAELAHLSRSVVPSQRCFSIQMLGRILHKLGYKKYQVTPVETEEDEEPQLFEELMWGLIKELQIVELLQDAADEKRTKNLSVRNYAIEALWLWKKTSPEEH